MKKTLRILLLALAAPAALAQAPACPAPGDLAQADLVGTWRAEFEGLWDGATLHLIKHPEYEGSLSGSIDRKGVRGQVAGDIEDGGLTVEESADGKRISGTFLTDAVEGACGREFRGTWQAEDDTPPRKVVLRKVEGPASR